jgi:Fe2+ or Zn2+ uptake regulation protein
MSATRNTRQKEAILKVLRGTHCHPTAGWVYEQVQQKLPHISLGTVYRDLKMLASSGDILELDFGNNPSRYDGNTSRHYHFRCLKCDNVYDIDEKVDLEMDRRVARKTGFNVIYHCLEFHGFCQQCQQGTHPAEDTAPQSIEAAAYSRNK